jgi:hypothetical protein
MNECEHKEEVERLLRFDRKNTPLNFLLAFEVHSVYLFAGFEASAWE